MRVLIIGIALAIIAYILYSKKENYDGPSLAFDPSTRAGIAGIGPKEGFCGACM